MISYYDANPPEFPLAASIWRFASSALLAELFHAELHVITCLLEENPGFDLPKLFDSPDATLPHRNTCFSLLAHRKLISLIDEQFVNRNEKLPTVDDAESSALGRTLSLVPADAPPWALAMEKVVELLPELMLQALPETLQKQIWHTNDREKDEDRRSTAQIIGTVEQIRALAEQVIDQQWQRLASRWNKKRAPRKRDKQRMARDRQIAEIDDVAQTMIEFLKIMDERKVKHQPTWSGWPGSWVQAYKNPRLQKLIHQDKSRAMARARSKHKK